MLTQTIKRHARQAKQDLRSMLARPGRFTFNYVRHVINIYNRADDFCSGDGLEIGALSVPFRFTNAKVQYADVADERDMRDILDTIPIENLYAGKLVRPTIFLRPPHFDLPDVPDGSLDFVYSSHSLEHSPNPLFALSEYFRAVRVGGPIYTIIPNKEKTYDVNRITTPVERLIAKFRDGIFDHTLEEAIDVVENSDTHPLYRGKPRAFAEEILANNTGIHHFHTFDPKSTIGLIDFCKHDFGCSLDYFCVEGINIHFCLKKEAASAGKGDSASAEGAHART